MLKDEFISMQRQDIETNNNEVLKQLLLAFEEVLKDYPLTTELSSNLTIEDCYNKMATEARNKAENNSYCFAPKETKEFIIKYLGLNSKQQETKQTTFINLEDFI